MTRLKSPYPYFGGKSRVADLVWKRFGNVPNFIEPFFGSGAVLLGRPHEPKTETINDKDGFVSNFWRAIQAAPEEVAKYADWPANENDLHARHIWLVEQREAFTRRLEGDPQYYDAKVAGWWVWGICCWIGSGWCSGNGPWQAVEDEEGHRQLVHLGDDGRGVRRQRVHLGNDGMGVHRKLVHLGDDGMGVRRKRVHLGDDGMGVHRQRVHLGDDGMGVHRKREQIHSMFEELSARMRNVRVASGDWMRVMGPSVTTKHGLTAVFLDPPYSAEANRHDGLYAQEDLSVAHSVREWCLENGDNPLFRIALCGYDGEHALPGWEEVAWKTPGGFGSQGEDKGRANAKRERIWFSPHCLKGRLL